MLQIKTIRCNPFEENCLLLWDGTGEGVIIDPGCYDEGELETLRTAVKEEGVAVKAIWLTHGHFDHIYGVRALAEGYGVKVYMHPDDKPLLALAGEMPARFRLKVPDTGFTTEDISGGGTLTFGETAFTVLHTPGHTPGSVCILDSKDEVLITGDTLFAGSIGRTDLPGGDYDKLIVSIMDTLMGLPSTTDILPGHGSRSDIGTERTRNPFLQPFNSGDDGEGDW